MLPSSKPHGSHRQRALQRPQRHSTATRAEWQHCHAWQWQGLRLELARWPWWRRVSLDVVESLGECWGQGCSALWVGSPRKIRCARARRSPRQGATGVRAPLRLPLRSPTCRRTVAPSVVAAASTTTRWAVDTAFQACCNSVADCKPPACACVCVERVCWLVVPLCHTR